MSGSSDLPFHVTPLIVAQLSDETCFGSLVAGVVARVTAVSAYVGS